MEWARKIGNMYKETVDYFKANRVRVVNMSWSQSLKEVENTLAANGIGKDAADQGKLAREMFAVLKDNFYEAIKNAPGILFVTSAGNEDNDPRFQDNIPGALDLPNILEVGAVDQAGDETSFTKTIRSIAENEKKKEIRRLPFQHQVLPYSQFSF
jgi:hypothetical protein